MLATSSSKTVSNFCFKTRYQVLGISFTLQFRYCLLGLVCTGIWLLDQDWRICVVFAARSLLWCWHFRLALSGCACFQLLVILLKWAIWSAPKNGDKVSVDVFCKVTRSWHALQSLSAVIRCSKWLNIRTSCFGYPRSNRVTNSVTVTIKRDGKSKWEGKEVLCSRN